MNTQISSSELKTNIIEFLKENKEGALATTINNIPRSSPVQYFLGEGFDIYIISAGGEKFNAISQNPNVCLLVNTSYMNLRKIKGVQIFGKAITSLQDLNLVDEAKKYSAEPYVIEYEKQSLKVIKIVPEEIVYLDSLKEGNRTKQILKNDEILIKQDNIKSV